MTEVTEENHPSREGHEDHKSHEAHEGHEKHEVHEGHESHRHEAKSSSTKKPNPWMVTSGLLAVAVIILIVYLVMSQIGPRPPVTTPAGSKVLVEEFSDFQCPACGYAFQAVEQLKKDYSDKITFVYKQFPLPGDSPPYHKLAQKAAEASECARDQEKFEEYYNKLFQENIRAYNAGENEPKMSVADLKLIAKSIGLDSSKFDSCLDSGAKAQIVNDQVQEGMGRGVNGTPTIFIGGTKFNGNFTSAAELKKAVDSKIASSGTGAAGTDQNKPDPEFDLVEVDDDSCTVCNQSKFPLLLTSSAFPSAKLVTYKASSAEGKKFISDFNLDILPAFLLEKEVEKTANFSQISQYLEKKGDYYVFPYALIDQISGQTGPLYAARRLLNAQVPLTDAPVLGNPLSEIKFVAFEDYQCPFCKRYEDETFPKLKENYIDSNKIAYYFKDYPFLGEDSKTAANAGQCVLEQSNSQFWKFLLLVFSKQGSENGGWAGEANIKEYVKDMNGLDQNMFAECLSSKKYSGRVSASSAFGKSIGGFGTPTLFINNIQVQGAYSYDTFKQIIDDEIAAKAK